MKKAIALTTFCLFIYSLAIGQIVPEWIANYGDNPVVKYTATDMALDNWGNVYVAGYGLDTSEESSAQLLKYNQDGRILWVQPIPHTRHNYVPKVRIDKQGNPIVSTYYWDSLRSSTFLTVKYDPQGDTIWTRRLNDQGAPSDIVIDDSSNVYVTGNIYDNTVYGIATMKYSAAGDLQWVTSYITTNHPYRSNAIAVDSMGGVYITGMVMDSGAMITIKYDRHGVQQWSRRYGYSEGLFIKIFDNQFLYAAGYDDTLVGFYAPDNFLLIKYDLNGNQIWATKYNSRDSLGQSFTGNEIPVDMKIDKNGNVYMAGSADAGNGGMAYSTVKFNPSGGIEWAKVYGSDRSGWNMASSLAIANSGKVYVTGYIAESHITRNATIIYGADGSILDTIKYKQTVNEDATAAHIVLYDENTIYVAASILMPDSDDISLVKYGISTGIQAVTGPSSGYQLFPNPAGNYCTLQLSGNAQVCSATVFDFMGKEVLPLFSNAVVSSFNFSVAKLSAGLYFVKVMDGNGAAGVMKLVKD